MKTQFKHISYSEKRKIYHIKVVAKNGKVLTKSSKDLNTALKYRNEIYKLLNINVYDEVVLKTFGEYAQKFLKTVKNDIKPSTLHKYQLCINKLNYYIEHEELTKIDVFMWEKIFDTIKEKNNYSNSTTRVFVVIAKKIYNHFNVECPINYSVKNASVHVKRRAFTEQEKTLFLKTAKQLLPFYKYFLFYLYFETGCRKGELIALKWNDVDFDNRLLNIRHAINKGIVNGEFGEFRGLTKNKKPRVIPISFKVMTILQAMKKHSHSEYVFWNDGKKYKWLSLSAVDRYFSEIRAEANLPSELVLHCTRHYFCTKLITRGVDISTVQALSGHGSSRVLLDFYAHSDMDNMINAIRKLHNF